MKKRHLGYTLIEIVMTLSIIGIAAALVGLGVAQMADFQNRSSVSVLKRQELQDLDSFVQGYVSFVDVKTASRNFAETTGEDFSNQDGIAFKYDDDHVYTLSFVQENKTIQIVGPLNDEMNKSKSFSSIQDVTFSWDVSLQLLTLKVTTETEAPARFAYSVRSNA